MIHYIGWNNEWDEWIEFDSVRVAKRGTHTNESFEKDKKKYESKPFQSKWEFLRSEYRYFGYNWVRPVKQSNF